MTAADLDYHLHHSYWTRLQQLCSADAGDLHSLSVSVNWPHRPQDMAFLLAQGGGLIARDQIGRPLGAGMSFEYGPDAAMVGMMMTHPKLQAGGLGREILNALEAALDGRNLRLNATKSAWRLYRAAGFRETGSVVQYQGISQRLSAPSVRSGLRAARPEDLPSILNLDSHVFGAPRHDVITRVFAASDCYVIEDAGQVTGFSKCRPFGRGHVIGPLIAASMTDAAALSDVFLAQHAGEFVRLDADARHADLGEHLNKRGLETYDTVVPMSKGVHFGPENADDYIYALTSQAIG